MHQNLLNKVGSNTLLNPPHTFTGDLYETHAPSFGGAFNPALVSGRKVGTASFVSSTLVAATLMYSVDGVSVSKSIERQTLRNLDFSGVYLGGSDLITSSCTIPSNNGKETADSAVLTIIQSGAAIRVVSQGSSSNCSFIGNYSQRGSIGFADGTYNCSDGSIGTFAFYGMRWADYGMSAGVSGKNQSCSFSGLFGGITVR
jgi:hypothetical protein